MLLTDINIAKQYRSNYYAITKPDIITIKSLLSSEYRYRHKLNKKHVKQLHNAMLKPDTLKRTFISKINKRIKIFDKNKDGKQTPYITHFIDVISHTLGICCRVCLLRWHKIEFNVILDDTQINLLSEFAMLFIGEFLMNSMDDLKTWFYELKNDDDSRLHTTIDNVYKFHYYYEWNNEFELYRQNDGKWNIIMWKIDKSNDNDNSNDEHSGDKRGHDNELEMPKKKKRKIE